jgi:type I restriction enzyme, S subunit
VTLPRYGRYKDSGIEWLGEVPAHWQVTRLKFIAHVQTGIAKGKDNTGKDTVEVPYLRVANVQDGYLDLEDVATIEIPVDDLPRYQLRAGDVLMNEGGDFDKLGRGHVWDGSIDPCIHQNHVFAVRPFGASPQWLNLITGSAYAQFYFMSRSKQSTNLASISSTNVMELPVVMPPAAEQERIAAFLSHETATIDRLIDEQRLLIDLLTEKRQAVIAYAVTKGLNPAAPNKDSRVEWLGAVPAHWKVMPMRLAARLESGHTPSRSRPDWWENCTVPWFSLADVWQIRDGGADVVYETKEMVSELGLANSSARILPKGTVVLSRTASVGFSAIMGVEMATTQDFANWVCGESLLPEYLLLVLRSMKGEFRRLMMGSTHNTIYMPDIQSFRFVLPPLGEQQEIVRYAKHAVTHFDSLVTEAAQAVELLGERRAALVSAAVTGQIDVRDTAARTKADALAPPHAKLGHTDHNGHGSVP